MCMLFLRFEEGGFPYLFTLPAELLAVSCLAGQLPALTFPSGVEK